MFELNLRGRVAEVTMCRPPVNAISEEWGEAFAALLDELGRARRLERAAPAQQPEGVRRRRRPGADPVVDRAPSGPMRCCPAYIGKLQAVYRRLEGAVARDAGRDRRRGARRRPRARAVLRPARRGRRGEDRPAGSRHRPDPRPRRHAAADAPGRPRHRGAPDPQRRAGRWRAGALARHRPVERAARASSRPRRRASPTASPACRCRR